MGSGRSTAALPQVTSPSATAKLRWHRVAVAGRKALYAEIGEGPPLVFFHGWGITSRAYARALPVLARSGVRVIAPALPGFGRSADLKGGLSWERLADWVDELLDAAHVDEPAQLVGHSFGGGVATMTAWHHRHRARSLVLVNSIGGSTWKSDGDGERSLAERPWWDWGLHAPTEWTTRAYRRVIPVVARDFAHNVVRHPGNLLRAGALARNADLRSELTDLSDAGMPITVLWGERDTMLPQAAFLALCQASGSSGSVVRGGHSWLIADPEGFGEAVTNSRMIHDALAKPRAARKRRPRGPAVDLAS